MRGNVRVPGGAPDHRTRVRGLQRDSCERKRFGFIRDKHALSEPLEEARVDYGIVREEEAQRDIVRNDALSPPVGNTWKVIFLVEPQGHTSVAFA